MHHKFVRALAGLGLCLALTACVDNDYDLSDVDTLVKIPVNNLTIPVNIEPIELDNIFNIDYNDPDNVVHVVNGEYAVEKGGSFDSGDISVAPISFTSPTIAPSKTVIDTGIGDLPAGMMPPALEFGLATGERTFSFSSGNVSRYIRDVDAVKCDMSLMLDIIFPELDGLVKAMTVSDLSLQLPRGLENVSVDGMSGAKYNKSTGVLTVPAFTATRANTMLSVRAGGVDIDFMEKAGEAEFKPSADNTDDGRFRIDGEFYILSGQCTVKASDLTVTDPSRLPVGLALYIPGFDEGQRPGIEVNGYAYPNISAAVLNETLPYLTFFCPFSYSMTAEGALRPGRLCDICPTMLALMGIPQPEEMTGESLLTKIHSDR